MVIGLQSTGEARTLEALEEGGGELNDFVSTAKYVQPKIVFFSFNSQKSQHIAKPYFSWRGVLQALVEKHFPAPDRQKLYSLLGIDLPVKKAPDPSVNTAAKTEQKGKKRKGNRALKLVCNSCNALN